MRSACALALLVVARTALAEGDVTPHADGEVLTRERAMELYWTELQKLPRGTLSLETSPPGVRIELTRYHPDGTPHDSLPELAFTTPGEVSLVSARYRVRATLPDHVESFVDVMIHPDATAGMFLILDPTPGILAIEPSGAFADRPLRIEIDGRVARERRISLVPGRHVVRFAAEDVEPIELDVETRSGQTTVLRPDGQLTREGQLRVLGRQRSKLRAAVAIQSVDDSVELGTHVGAAIRHVRVGGRLVMDAEQDVAELGLDVGPRSLAWFSAHRNLILDALPGIHGGLRMVPSARPRLGPYLDIGLTYQARRDLGVRLGVRGELDLLRGLDDSPMVPVDRTGPGGFAGAATLGLVFGPSDHGTPVPVDWSTAGANRWRASAGALVQMADAPAELVWIATHARAKIGVEGQLLLSPDHGFGGVGLGITTGNWLVYSTGEWAADLTPGLCATARGRSPSIIGIGACVETGVTLRLTRELGIRAAGRVESDVVRAIAHDRSLLGYGASIGVAWTGRP